MAVVIRKLIYKKINKVKCHKTSIGRFVGDLELPIIKDSGEVTGGSQKSDFDE